MRNIYDRWLVLIMLLIGVIFIVGCDSTRIAPPDDPNSGPKFLPNSCITDPPFFCEDVTVSSTTVGLILQQISGAEIEDVNVKIEICDSSSKEIMQAESSVTFEQTCDYSSLTPGENQKTIVITYTNSQGVVMSSAGKIKFVLN